MLLSTLMAEYLNSLELFAPPQSRNAARSPEADSGDEGRGVRATSYDVARLAGVSQSAVSRAFREGGSVSSKTRRKVEEAARALGYAPSQIARSLISQRSRIIAVIANFRSPKPRF